jgi:hypothetical protein
MAAGNATEPGPPLQLVCSQGLQVLPDGCTAKLVPHDEGERHRLSNEVKVLQLQPLSELGEGKMKYFEIYIVHISTRGGGIAIGLLHESAMKSRPGMVRLETTGNNRP